MSDTFHLRKLIDHLCGLGALHARQAERLPAEDPADADRTSEVVTRTRDRELQRSEFVVVSIYRTPLAVISMRRR